jgi:hypothetical protein
MAAASGRAPLAFLIAAAIAGCVLRAAFGLGYWTGQPLTRDESEYLSLARGLAGGRGFTYEEAMLEGPVPPFGRAPGYPAFLAIVGGGRDVAASVPASVKLAQSIVGGVGIVLVGLLAFRLAGAWAARAASLVAAVYPPLVWIAGYALSEALFWPIGLGCALLYDGLTAGTRSRASVALALGVLAGLGVLVRPALLLFVVLALLAVARRGRWRACAAFIAGVIVVVGPWTARNYAVHDRLMLVASDGGVTFWTGNHPLAIGEGDMAANPELKIANRDLRARHPGLTEEQMEPVYYREAWAWIRDHPLDFITLELKKLFYLVVPIGPSYTLHSTRYLVASVASYGVLLMLAIAGAYRLGGWLARTPGLWLLLLSSVMVSLIFFPQERFRIPIIDPALIVLASGLVVGARRRNVGGESRMAWTQPD